VIPVGVRLSSWLQITSDFGCKSHLAEISVSLSLSLSLSLIKISGANLLREFEKN
jgi:hypothetical protein